MCSGRQSGVSLFEQIVNCSSRFCPLVTVNLAIILHGRLKVGMACQYPNNFWIIVRLLIADRTTTELLKL